MIDGIWIKKKYIYIINYQKLLIILLCYIKKLFTCIYQLLILEFLSTTLHLAVLYSLL